MNEKAKEGFNGRVVFGEQGLAGREGEKNLSN